MSDIRTIIIDGVPTEVTMTGIPVPMPESDADTGVLYWVIYQTFTYPTGEVGEDGAPVLYTDTLRTVGDPVQADPPPVDAAPAEQ